MDNKIAFGIITILFNCYGIPSFLKGFTKEGVWQLVLCFVTCGIVSTINGIMGIIMGIKILMMSDEEFAAADPATLIMAIPAPKKPQ